MMKAALLGFSSLTLTGAMLASTAAYAQNSTSGTAKVQINIPAQSMETALNTFAKQVGKQIVFYSSDAKRLRAGPLVGTFTERQALSNILRNSGLEFIYVNEKTIGVRRKTQTAGLSHTNFQSQSSQLGPEENRDGQVSASGEIVVSGRRLDQNLAIEAKRSADQIIDTITADQSSRLPDNNVVEALGRIPGVSFRRDSNTGDGTHISIRGLDSALNNVQFDGINAGQSGNDGTRRVGLEGINADDIAELRIAKSLLPQDEGEGIGGAVNIITKTALERGKDRLTLGAEGRLYDFHNREGFQFNAGFTKLFSDNFGINLSGSFRRRETVNYRINSSDLEPFTFTGVRTIGGEFISAADLIALNDAKNAEDAANGDRSPDDDFYDAGTLLNDVLPGQYDTADLAFQRQSYSVNDQTRDTYNISGSLDWQISPSTKLTLGGRFNHETRDQAIHKLDFQSDDLDFSVRPDGVLRTDVASSQTGFRLEVADRDRTSGSAYLRGKSDFGRLKLNYLASYSVEKNKSPDSEVEFRQNNTIRDIFRNRDPRVPPATVTTDQHFAPYTFPNRFTPRPNLGVLTIPGFDQLLGDVNNSYRTQIFDIQQVDNNTNNRYALRFDGEYNLDHGPISTVKFGAKYERSDTKTNSRRIRIGDGRIGRDGTFNPVNNPLDNDVNYGDYDQLFTNEFVSLDKIGNPLEGYPITGIPRVNPEGFRSIIANFNRTLDDRAPADFSIRDLREEIWAGYAQAEFETDRVSLVGGVRVEHYIGNFVTTQLVDASRLTVDNRGAPLNGVRTRIPLLNEGSLADQLTPVASRNTDTQILPRLNARFTLTDNLQLRGGFGYSLARPSLRQLSQTGEIDFDITVDDAPGLLTATTIADVVAAGGLPLANVRESSSTDLDIEQGNPNLKPARSRNIDLSLEWYPRSGTSVSIGLFHKSIDNFIFINNEPVGTADGNIVLDSVTSQFGPDTIALFEPFGGLAGFLSGPGSDLIDVSLLQPQNGGTATIKGIEFGVNHQFDWAPGFLKDMGFNGNITFTDSDAELPDGRYDSNTDLNVLLGDAVFLEDLPARNVPFFNSPEVTANALLYYDANGLDIGISYSYQSASFNELDEFGLNQYDDTYEQWDFSISYELPKKIMGGRFKVYFEVPDFTDGGRKPTSVQTVGKNSNLYDLAGFNGREYRFGIRGKF